MIDLVNVVERGRLVPFVRLKTPTSGEIVQYLLSLCNYDLIPDHVVRDRLTPGPSPSLTLWRGELNFINFPLLPTSGGRRGAGG